MNKNQGNHFKMFLNTQDFLNNQTPVWSIIPRISNYKTELDEVISGIVSKSESAKSSVGVSERKESLKLTIALKVASLSGALQAYTHDKGDDDLTKKVKFSKSDVEKIKEQDLDAEVKSLVSTAQGRLAELADFGITEAHLSEILNSLDEFNSLIGKPRSILNNKFVTLNSIEQLFNEGNNLLRNRMDNIMLMFKDTNPEFYNGYERARTIVDL